MKNILFKFISLLSIVCILAGAFQTVSAADKSWVEEIDEDIDVAVLNKENSYSEYITRYKENDTSGKEITVDVGSVSKKAEDSDIRLIESFEGKSNVTVWGNSPDWAEWNFSVEEDGLYELIVVYYPLKQSMRSIETAVKIDGEFPFCEAASIALSSAYKSEYPIRQDSKGNDYNSSQIEVARWYDEALRNDAGIQDDPFCFWLDKGEHSLTLFLMQETFALAEIRFKPVLSEISYSEYVKNHSETSDAKNFSKMLQAEEYNEKSHSSIMPKNDQSSTKNKPFSYYNIKLNIISGENWLSAGQWLEWSIDIPESGWYELDFRYSQSYNKNIPAHRRLYIDGKVPFAEADCFELQYEEKWKLASLCDDNGDVLSIWFDKGEHTIRLEAVLGEIQDVIYSVNDIVYELNHIYQRINMIVGASPDMYRDYNLQNTIPEMLEIFSDCSKELKAIRKTLKELSGGRGTTAGIMDVLAYQLDDMIASPSSIPMRVSSLNSNISSLSAVAEELKSQALDLDYILISSPDAEKPVATDNIFISLFKETVSFLYSFISDYETFSVEGSGEPIKVWFGGGRDQAQVLNRMVNDMFVPNYGISVKLQLANASLIQSMLANNAPDVMLMTSRGQPVNLAIRGALADLSKMSGFEEVKKEYQNDALRPYYYNNGCYGLPDSQSYFMMFYRKDIFKELGLKIPETWDELFDIMQILHINNLDIGIPYAGITAAGAVDEGLSSTSIFSALLLQNGGEFYNSEGTKTALTTPQATEAFIKWTDLYTDYSLDMSYSFLNRFRTGTMPIGIAGYTMYNQIYVTAPEIRNLWTMTAIPGTRMADGSINRSQGGSGTACVMTSTSKNKNDAWEFMRWWIGEDAQTRYSIDIESALGMSARYATANKNAFTNIQWSRNEYHKLTEQWKWVKEVPEIPGSYYTVRGLDNAFRSVVLNGKNPKETLVKYSRSIDAEIKRKRAEFALDKQ